MLKVTKDQCQEPNTLLKVLVQRAIEFSSLVVIMIQKLDLMTLGSSMLKNLHGTELEMKKTILQTNHLQSELQAQEHVPHLLPIKARFTFMVVMVVPTTKENHITISLPLTLKLKLGKKLSLLLIVTNQMVEVVTVCLHQTTNSTSMVDGITFNSSTISGSSIYQRMNGMNQISPSAFQDGTTVVCWLKLFLPGNSLFSVENN